MRCSRSALLQSARSVDRRAFAAIVPVFPVVFTVVFTFLHLCKQRSSGALADQRPPLLCSPGFVFKDEHSFWLEPSHALHPSVCCPLQSVLLQQALYICCTQAGLRPRV